MRVISIVGVLALFGALPAFAQMTVEPPASAVAPVRNLDSIVITGAQPGPGMWRVGNGDNVLWVLGTMSPLPKNMQWQSRDVENVIARAQEEIRTPALSVGADVGFFRGVMLAPKALGARRNPGDAKLQDVVPAELYARWLVLKKKYMGRDNGVEKWRPMFAAMELYREAIDGAGLSTGGIVGPVLSRAAKAHKLKQTSPTVKIVIKDPKAALSEFRASRLDDIDCFRETLHRIETDLEAMRARANAWAVGDIQALRALPYSDHNEACLKAALHAGVVRKRSSVDVDADLEKQWLAAAEKALANNKVTFAALPMREMLHPDGYISKLQARGYVVEAPE